MQTINAQTIINQLQALAITAPDHQPDAYKTIKEKHAMGRVIEKQVKDPSKYIKIQISATGYASIINDKKHLQTFADKVRKNAAAFGGGLIKTVKARPAITWPAGPVKLVAEMLEDGQQGEAAALAIRKCGALFFKTGRAPFMAWAPQAVEGLPEYLASVRCSAAGNKWQVIHLASGQQLGANFATRKAAEAGALELWQGTSETTRERVASIKKLDDTEDARAQYLAAAGITNAEDLQPEAAPVRKAAKATAPAQVQAATVADVLAETIAAAHAAAAIETATEAAAVDAIATTKAEEQPQAEELSTVAAMAEGDSHQAGRALIGRVAPAQVERGQVIASKSGNWSAVFFNCPSSGLPSMRFMHSEEDGRGQDSGTYETGRERMADLQRKAKAADHAAAQRAEAAKEAAKPAALAITLERLEGPADECGKPQTMASFEDADRLLLAWSETAPKNGGYSKTRARVVWPDGTDYSCRLDLVHHSRELPSLRAELASTAEFWTGKRCPDHMTGEQYAATVARCSESDAAFYAHMLDLLTQAGHFSKAQPQHCPDMLQLIEHLKIDAGKLVGFGVSTYSPDTSETKAGAITSAEKITRWHEELKIIVTYEDGTTAHLDANGFADKSGARFARHRLDGRMHGAPYLAQLAAAVASKNAAETSAKERADQAHAQALQRLQAENPTLMTWAKAKEAGRKLGGHTMAAHNIRILLKAAFPGVKFSVKSDSFSMGDSVDVSWTDGPTAAEVDAIAGKFSAGSFSGMDDSYTYTSSPWGELFGSSKYVNTSRSLSDAAVAEILASIYPEESNRPTVADYHAGRVRDEHGRSPVYMASHTWKATAKPGA